MAKEETEVKAKKDSYSVEAWYSYIDKEGFKIKAEFKSEGSSISEMLNGMEFPKGVNRLVNVTLKHGEESFQRAVAAHTARRMFEDKDAAEFQRLFKGV